jgi:hypothetical protein
MWLIDISMGWLPILFRRMHTIYGSAPPRIGRAACRFSGHGAHGLTAFSNRYANTSRDV